MNRLPLALSASVFALAVAAPAHAQNFYAGLGVESGKTTLDIGGGDDFDGDITNVSVFAGVRLHANNFFYGAEVETTLSSEASNDVFGDNDIDRVTRLRAMGGYDFGRWSGFVAAGGTWVDGSPFFNGFGDGANGWNVGVGGEYSFTDHFAVRAEVIHDETEFNDGNYEWHNTSLRAGAIVRF